MEYLFNRPPDVSFHLEYVRQLHESPTAITAEPIHSGSPVPLHTSLLFFCVLAAVPLDLDNQMKWLVRSVSVVDYDDKVRQVALPDASGLIWNLKAQAMVLDVSQDTGMGLHHTAQLSFPIAVQNDPVYVALSGVGLPTIPL